MPFVERSGSSLWYQIDGKGEALVLIGGFALVHDQFAFALPHLTPHFRTLNWHYRGVGLSDWSLTEPYTLEGWVEDLLAVMDAARIRSAHIWATSTGSAIGVRFASKYPQRVRSLITYPWIRSDQAWRDIFEITHQVGSKFGMHALSKLFFSVVLPTDEQYSESAGKMERWMAESYERNVNPATLKNVSDSYANVDLTGDVRRLKCPTLLLLGDEGPVRMTKTLESTTFDSLVESFRELKSDCEIAAIHGAGSTYCMLTKPAETCKVVVRFIKRQSNT